MVDAFPVYIARGPPLSPSEFAAAGLTECLRRIDVRRDALGESGAARTPCGASLLPLPTPKLSAFSFSSHSSHDARHRYPRIRTCETRNLCQIVATESQQIQGAGGQDQGGGGDPPTPPLLAALRMSRLSRDEIAESLLACFMYCQAEVQHG